MFIFKLFTFNNIICYVSYFIMFIFIFFILYKYLYLEQTVYLLSNKVNKLEIEFNTLNESLDKKLTFKKFTGKTDNKNELLDTKTNFKVKTSFDSICLHLNNI